MRQSILTLILAALGTTLAAGQSPSFDVASVKPNHSEQRFAKIGQVTGGRFEVENISVTELLLDAFHLERFQLANAPAWTTTERFDVKAKAADGNITPVQLRQMIQRLLADRFQLTIHHETRDLPAYELLVAKSGSKLKEAQEKTCAGDPVLEHPCGGFRIYRRTQLTGFTVTVKQLADELTFMLDRPVIDKSGIQGLFDMKMEWSTDQFGSEAGAQSDLIATLFQALPEQLGLRLQSQHAPVDVVVVDRIQRPSGN